MAASPVSKSKPLKQLVMHVHVDGNRVYSGIVDRNQPAPVWIPAILRSASTHTGLNLTSKQAHPNDLKWTHTNTNRANVLMDSLELDAFVDPKN